MKVLVLMGSPRKQGNTAALLRPFSEELQRHGHETETVWLYDRDIRPCVACLKCQEDWNDFGCSQWDDVPQLFHKILDCDLLVLATPIYAWYGRASRWRCWRAAATVRKRAATSLRRECAATASTPD